MRNPTTRPPYEVALIFTRDPDETPSPSGAMALPLPTIHVSRRHGRMYGWLIVRAPARVQEAA